MIDLLKFQISSPGKVILHGEHSVVYGKPALAGVVGLRNYLNFEENNEKYIQIVFSKMNLIFSIDIAIVNRYLKEKLANFLTKKLPEEINHDLFLINIKEFIIKNDNTNTISKDENKLRSLLALFYLLYGIFIEKKIGEIVKGFMIEMQTEMSIGAGLGSSASFGVCLASCFYFYARLQDEAFKSECRELNFVISDEMKQNVSKWAFCSEKIMHGNPSGLDNTICTFGNIVKFYKGKLPTNIKLNMPLNILLVDTAVSRSTAILVKNVAELKAEYPELLNHILNAFGELVENVTNTFENTSDPIKFYEKMRVLTSINNNLLRSIGVSHQTLEKIFSIAESNGFSAKLTGAGGGGFATILLPPYYENEPMFLKLCDQLTDEKFEWSVTTVGGDGLRFKLL